MKHYIIFTINIHRIGGSELLTAGRANYLEGNGWKVTIFFAGDSSGESEIPSLTKYISGCGFVEMWEYRPYKVSERYRDQILDKMLQILRIDSSIPNEILIESHDDFVAYWAELLAERIHGRNFYVATNEFFRTLGNEFENNLDFFAFKESRGELICTPSQFQKLFNGYRGLHESRLKIPAGIQICREQDAIQDVENKDVESKLRGGGGKPVNRVHRAHRKIICPCDFQRRR